MTKVLENQGSVFIQDADKEVNSTASMANFNIKTVICLPLTVKNELGQRELIGLIYADKTLSTTPLPSGINSSLQSLRKITSYHLVRTMKNDDANDGLDNFKNYFNSLKGELSKIKDYLQDTSQHIEVGTSSESNPSPEKDGKDGTKNFAASFFDGPKAGEGRPNADEAEFSRVDLSRTVNAPNPKGNVSQNLGQNESGDIDSGGMGGPRPMPAAIDKPDSHGFHFDFVSHTYNTSISSCGKTTVFI